MNSTRIVTAKSSVIRTHQSLIPFWKMWLACFVAAGLYGVVLSGLVALIFGATVFGALTTDVTTSVLGGLLLLVLTGPVSVFVVPILTKMLVRSIARARVGLFWTTTSVLVGWVVVTALSTLLWLIPGAQPLAALMVWAGSTALTAWLLHKRSTPAIDKVTVNLAAPTPASDQVTKQQVDEYQAAPHTH
jgi:hypothetical protein